MRSPGRRRFAFNAVGDFTGHTPDFGTAQYAENVAGHALVGCASSAASGGSCESGALSGAVGSALSPISAKLFPDASTDFGQRIGGTVIEATAGGLASMAGGGTFANGAVTSAFGYLFNELIKVTPSGGQIIGPYGEVYVPFSLLPASSQQILQYRVFYFDTEAGTWSVGYDVPVSGTDISPTFARRGPDRGTLEVGFVMSPPGSPPVRPGENPQSAVRVGYVNAATRDPYYVTYNANGQTISPVTGRTVDRNTAHYPIDPPEWTVKP